MKRLTSFIFLFAVIGSMSISDAFSAKRWVLVEEFTNASCAPCASQNPTFKTFLNNNTDRVIPIIYRTSWPGRDDMYSLRTAMYDNRVNYYGVGDVGVPYARTNGKLHPTTTLYEGAPGDAVGMQQEVDKYASATSPMTITPTFTKTGNEMKINVNVASTEAVNNKTLRVAVVEAYHYFKSAGSNGETNFYYVVREMLPSADGQSISVTANGNKDFSFSVTPHPSVYPQFMYVVAFVQDETTKEVLQAGTSPRPDITGVENFKKVPVTVTTDAPQKHGFVEGGSPATRTIKVTNPNLKEMTFSLVPTLEAPQDWSASLDKEEVTLAAGASAEIKATINAGSTLAYASLSLGAFPINLPANELGEYSSSAVYALHKGTKIVNYVGLATFEDYLMAVTSNSPTYKGITNYLGVLDMEAMAAYPPENFDVLVYNLDYWALKQAAGILGNTYNESKAIRNNIKQSLAAGKNVLIFGEREAYNAFINTSAIEGQTFYKQDIGVSSTSSTPRANFNSTGQVTSLIPYRVDGVSGDPISNGLTFSCNNHQYSNSFFTFYTDILKLETGSKAIPFLYSDAMQNNIVAIRTVNAAKGKLVYISAPPSGFEINQLATLYNNTIAWFYSNTNVGPKITAAVSSVSFGTVNKDEKSSKIVRITNSGDENLVINSIAIEGDTKSVFTLGEGKNTETLGAGASADIEVIFAPKAKENYTGQLRIQTNAGNTPDLKVALAGIGEDLTSVGEIGGKFYLNVSPNPVVSVSNVKYEINNDMPINLSINLIDAQGNKVAELFNGVSGNGSYNLNLNSANFAAGAYYLSVLVDGQLNNVPVMIVK